MLINTKDMSVPCLLKIWDALVIQCNREAETLSQWDHMILYENTTLDKDVYDQMKVEFHAILNQKNRFKLMLLYEFPKALELHCEKKTKVFKHVGS